MDLLERYKSEFIFMQYTYALSDLSRSGIRTVTCSVIFRAQHIGTWFPEPLDSHKLVNSNSALVKNSSFSETFRLIIFLKPLLFEWSEYTP